MGEKRQRKQQTRRRRATARSGSRPSARGPRGARGAGAAIERETERELASLLGTMAEIAAADAHAPCDALEAEQWASGMVGMWRVGPLPDPDADRLFGPGLVRALEGVGDAGALATLRALAAVGAESYAGRARAAADRLGDAGVAEPPWSRDVGRMRPEAAVLMHEPTFDDGASVMVEFAAPGGERHTLGVYIDHNMGGLVKDVFIAGPLAEVHERFSEADAQKGGLALRELDLAEARARVEDALDILDHTFDPPVDEDVRPLRALIAARMRALPEGRATPDELEELAPEERERLLTDFLESPEGRRWRGDDDAEDAASLAIDFGADYNHGGPLRWSPVVVEIFLTSWLPRKVAREREFFEQVPAVLKDWVAYAGRRRGVPASRLREATAAVRRYRREMLKAVEDPGAWGPAKAFAVAAQRAGVDLSDDDAVGEFVERYNDNRLAG
jgi:hypothetical protein